LRGKLEAGHKTNRPAGKPARELEAGQAGNFPAGHASWEAGSKTLTNLQPISLENFCQ